jgi:hypothetical protein
MVLDVRVACFRVLEASKLIFTLHFIHNLFNLHLEIPFVFRFVLA